MIVPSDPDYQITKNCKKDGIPLQSPFKELADWIDSQYGVKALNFYSDKIITGDRPRLNVIFEFKEDQMKFYSGMNYDSVKQENIRKKFQELLKQQTSHQFDTNRLFVCFSAFEPIAREEANGKVTENEIQRLMSKLDNSDLWKIRRSFDIVTFFFHTEAQKKDYEAKGASSIFAQEYSGILKSHDEFGYFKRRDVNAFFDSKENFDTKYQSNWFYYDR